MGKAKNALSDLDRVLQLNPDFTPARVTRGNVHLKLGNYDLAQLDLYNVVRVVFWLYRGKRRVIIHNMLVIDKYVVMIAYVEVLRLSSISFLFFMDENISKF